MGRPLRLKGCKAWQGVGIKRLRTCTKMLVYRREMANGVETTTVYEDGVQVSRTICNADNASKPSLRGSG